ncbi:hypothetical protein QOZ80_6BG0502250 [Eleusine coracana subsp. coracana]|nr:hypothetical protein QOZ80_6BG0502250 [Eleusine coracana subsp. coracana]
MATHFATAGGGGPKRQRLDEQEGPCEGALTETIPVDRISVLPDELRQRLLTHLSLKEAIRSGSLAYGWRDLWKSRWAHRSSVEIHLNSRDALRRELEALDREPRPRRRLDRFSLIVECRVEDLHVETRKSTVADKLNFHLPPSSPLLARLWLRRINISSLFYKDAQPFHALEVIRLHSVNISQTTVKKMMALCPSLLTLDLRDCDSDDFFYSDKSLVFPPKLRSVTIVECEGLATLDMVGVSSLRAFCYSGDRRSFSLPKDAVLTDLYICLDDWLSGNSEISLFNKFLPNDLSGLTVLTICSNVLMGASSSWHYERAVWLTDFLSSREQQGTPSLVDVESMVQNPKLGNLQSLRELQLLMLKMGADNLSNIYMFLKTCQCPNLERLFVQLPTIHYEPMKASIDEVVEESPEGALENLKIVKIVNFNWCRIETCCFSEILQQVLRQQLSSCRVD